MWALSSSFRVADLSCSRKYLFLISASSFSSLTMYSLVSGSIWFSVSSCICCLSSWFSLSVSSSWGGISFSGVFLRVYSSSSSSLIFWSFPEYSLSLSWYSEMFVVSCWTSTSSSWFFSVKFWSSQTCSLRSSFSALRPKMVFSLASCCLALSDSFCANSAFRCCSSVLKDFSTSSEKVNSDLQVLTDFLRVSISFSFSRSCSDKFSEDW
mmetsp:Transcript_11527/g.16963  ORF Transcript_11527/g.16963 Transcript_11527/m.16963 type:complete len:210 (-) Transcript_11527:1233-1862(-)